MDMLRVVPVILTMAMFTAIGIYWAVCTRHFLKWTSRYNASFNSRTDKPVQSAELQESLASESGKVVLTWGVRLTGVALAGAGMVTICRLIMFYY